MSALRTTLILGLIMFLDSLSGFAEKDSGFENRLIHEKSPYLLQHARNPVDWFPWGPEAFEKAKAEDKPIFLSIGYSTCHWCHVMEEESFTDSETAKLLNKYFVSIKVDREERPDIDAVYMNAVMKMIGSGGWPLNVFLNHRQEPFAGGTYFPPVAKWGKPSFKELLKKLANDWKERREEIMESGLQLSTLMKAQTATAPNASFILDEATLKKAYQRFKWQFDPIEGGFGRAPKFPRAHIYSFLLRYAQRADEDYALKITTTSLEAIAAGGIRDHLGGGFHRYSTDSKWFLPHFEKMLYDQALLAKAYLETYQVTGVEIYAQTAREILDYVLRDMTSPQGPFYSAEDADSLIETAEGEVKREGAFYVWGYAEIRRILSEKAAEIFSFHYGVKPTGNVSQDPHREFTGQNILYVEHSVEITAEHFEMSVDQITISLRESRAKLLRKRSLRRRPHLDDKILVDWNGLMISTLSFASRVLEEPRYSKAGAQAADFIMDRMKGTKGRLMHRYRDGEVAIKGFLTDYAFFSYGLLDLYEATFDPVYLQEAVFLLRQMVELFWDKQEGGFFLNARDQEALLTNPKELYDGAIPSGNSVATLALLKASRFTAKQDLEIWADSNFDTFSEDLFKYPSRFPQLLCALDFALGPSKEIVIAGSETNEQTQIFIREIYARFLPNKVVSLHPATGEKRKQIESLAPYLKHQKQIKGKPAVYVCENHVCKLPTTELATLQKLLA